MTICEFAFTSAPLPNHSMTISQVYSNPFCVLLPFRSNGGGGGSGGSSGSGGSGGNGVIIGHDRIGPCLHPSCFSVLSYFLTYITLTNISRTIINRS